MYVHGNTLPSPRPCTGRSLPTPWLSPSAGGTVSGSVQASDSYPYPTRIRNAGHASGISEVSPTLSSPSQSLLDSVTFPFPPSLPVTQSSTSFPLQQLKHQRSKNWSSRPHSPSLPIHHHHSPSIRPKFTYKPTQHMGQLRSSPVRRFVEGLKFPAICSIQRGDIGLEKLGN